MPGLWRCLCHRVESFASPAQFRRLPRDSKSRGVRSHCRAHRRSSGASIGNPAPKCNRPGELGPVNPTGLAQRGNVHSKDPASTRENRNVGHINCARRFLGLRQGDSNRQESPSSTALAGAGATGWYFAGRVNQSVLCIRYIHFRAPSVTSK
jgi:hypothetical protein